MATKTSENGSVNRIKGKEKHVTITAPNMKWIEVEIRGTSPYVQNKFDARKLNEMHETQAAGSTAKKGKKRKPKDFEADFRGATHVGVDGDGTEFYGIPAAAFRCAMVSACKLVGFHMTKGKLGIFVGADGYDKDTPLVKMVTDPPEYLEKYVRVQSTTDLRARPMFRNWSATVRIQFDADMFTETDVLNLMLRVGLQVGVGEGRPDSRTSCGMGWGHFEVV